MTNTVTTPPAIDSSIIKQFSSECDAMHVKCDNIIFLLEELEKNLPGNPIGNVDLSTVDEIKKIKEIGNRRDRITRYGQLLDNLCQ